MLPSQTQYFVISCILFVVNDEIWDWVVGDGVTKNFFVNLNGGWAFGLK